MYELLNSWGDTGFDAHLKKLQKDYGDKSRTIIQGFEEHMQGLGEWVAPRYASPEAMVVCVSESQSGRFSYTLVIASIGYSCQCAMICVKLHLL